MTVDQVRALVNQQAAGNLAATNAHRITLGQAITAPERISIIRRTVSGGHLIDEVFEAWLVGQEDRGNGYKIVMQEDGEQFGLASTGFTSDKHLVFVGWYGSSLVSAFAAM